jgi:hypothetical protein
MADPIDSWSERPSRSLAQEGVPCQLEGFPPSLETGAPSRHEPWSWYVRRRVLGLLLRLRWEWSKLWARPHKAMVPPKPRPAPLPGPELQPGDRVRVRSAEYVQSTLDVKGYLKGCGFGLGQYQYCGREFRVIRRVDSFFDEAQGRMLRGRNLVLLHGVHCDGSSSRWTNGCDRMCFYFWRTEWLEKIEEGD